jgi:hypothetical protein
MLRLRVTASATTRVTITRTSTARSPPSQVSSQAPINGDSGITHIDVNCMAEETRPWSSSGVCATR